MRKLRQREDVHLAPNASFTLCLSHSMNSGCCTPEHRSLTLLPLSPVFSIACTGQLCQLKAPWRACPESVPFPTPPWCTCARSAVGGGAKVHPNSAARTPLGPPGLQHRWSLLVPGSKACAKTTSTGCSHSLCIFPQKD
ncbi:hypothetical protein mRhiFer1_009025 [Rhinolophus ferrumequinum]|uniref:Uncharacterized protein n=1 Tax=Rhinolophus ferrumequinum TaxID=59479 RepID=A0A7J7SXN4_RHIFE|nr:hypothetical protein mRhiFer1_009025 [Rhinolophus ferrumequinum]